MSMHALGVVLAGICAFLGIWIAESLSGRPTDPVKLAMWSLIIGVASIVILSVFRSRRT